ncbi:MAG: acyl-CoA dehydrogenase family protein [Dehalococcoidia bacterium]
MNLKFSADEEAFRQEVRDFIKKEVPSDFRGADADCQYEEEGIEEVHKFAAEMRKKLAAKGWLGMTWPKEYGGQEAPFMYDFILAEEMNYNKIPGRDLYGVSIVGPTILRLGTEEQKQKYLGEITRGEVVWSEGMSEPEAGSDLASLKTKATLDGEEWVINGEKIWSSGAHVADRYLLFARTDPEAPPNKGITCFILDLKNTPGITMQTIQHMDGLYAFNSVWFEDARVPKDAVFGGETKGFKVILETLNFERPFSGLAMTYAKGVLDQLWEYCKETRRNGIPLVEHQTIRQKLADCATRLEVGRMMSYNVVWMQSQNLPTPKESTMIKLYGIETTKKVYDTGMEILGLYGQLDEESKWAPLRGEVKYLYMRAIGLLSAGGTLEIMRNTLAGAGLRMPRG